MSRIQTITEYQPICNCGNAYGDPLNSEAKARAFLERWPMCFECEEAP